MTSVSWPNLKDVTKKLNCRRLDRLGNCYRSVVCWITSWELAQADDNFLMNDHPSPRIEMIAESCPVFWHDVCEEIVFTATQPLPHTSNWTWQYRIWKFSSYFENKLFL